MKLLAWIKGREKVVTVVAAGEMVQRSCSGKSVGAKAHQRGLWKVSAGKKSKMVPKILARVTDIWGWHLLKRGRLGRSRFEAGEDSVLDLWHLRCLLGIQVEMPGWQLNKWVWRREGSLGWGCRPGWPQRAVHSPGAGWDHRGTEEKAVRTRAPRGLLTFQGPGEDGRAKVSARSGRETRQHGA